MNSRLDSNSFRALHDRHAAVVRGAVSRYLQDPHDVEDVLQDTFLRAYVALSREPLPETSLRPWLITVARNRAIDLIRARRPTQEIGERPGGASAAAVHECREHVRETVAAVRRLPDAQRRALVLHAVDGERYAAVGRELDVTPAAAKALAWRGRDAVRRDVLGQAA